jgi:hypothetical protein
MGGELEARLFIGVMDSKPISEWVFLLLKSKKQIIEEFKNNKEFIAQHMEEYGMTEEEIFEDEDDGGFIDNVYIYNFLERDLEMLKKKLSESGLQFVCSHNCRAKEVRVGRLLSEDANPWLVRESEEDIAFWKGYGYTDICIFSGLYGDLEYTLQ